MQDLTEPRTSTSDDAPPGASPPATTRTRLRATVLALTFALVAAGCSADASTEEVTGTDEAAADTGDSTSTDNPTTGDDMADETGSDPNAVQRLEDVAGGGELIELSPGLYTGDLLDGLVVSVGEGTSVYFDEDDPFVNYAFDKADGSAFVLPITGVVPPERVGSPVATEELDDVLTEVPDDLGTYLDAIPQLEILDSGATDTYRWWDFQVRPDLGDVHSECGPPDMECISLFGEPTGEATLNTMVGWTPRIVQPLAEPSILLWAAGQDGTIGSGHELTLELAEGFAQTPPPHATGDLGGGQSYRSRSLDPELRFTIPEGHGERSWEAFFDVPNRLGLRAQRPSDTDPDGPPVEIGLLQIVPVPGETSVDAILDTVMTFAEDSTRLELNRETGQIGGEEVPVLRGRAIHSRPVEVPLPDDSFFLATPGQNNVFVITGASQIFLAIVDASEVSFDLVLERATEVLETIEFP